MKESMWPESELYTFVARVKEIFALSDPTVLASYCYLLVYAFLNVALVMYRRSLSIGGIVYLLILGIMYAVSFFWEGKPSIFFWLYGGAAFYAILLEGRRVLTPFTPMNLFYCVVVIPNAAGNLGSLSLDMFFE